MSHYKTYNRIIGIPLVIFAIIITSIYIYMDPLVGDMTRLGGFLENDYGWNRKHEVFSEPLYKYIKNLDEYDKYYDVVILDDSFSFGVPERTWTNYFSMETGLSILGLHVQNTSIDELINSEQYKKNPPRLLIYQSIERALLARNHNCSGIHKTARKNKIDKTWVFSRRNIVLKSITRKQMATKSGFVGMGPAFSHFKTSFSRIMHRHQDGTHPIVRRTALSTSGLFTNRDNTRLLYYRNDEYKRDWTADNIKTIACSLADKSAIIEASGKTQFFAMIFPDKLSVYESYTKDAHLNNLSVIKRISSPFYTTVRLDKVFSAAINKGTADVYLPNDTHCSDIGYKLAADALISKLISNTN